MRRLYRIAAIKRIDAASAGLLALSLGTLAALACGSGWTLVLVTMLGVQNHFIYLALPASLVVLFGARAAWLKEEGASGRLRDSAGALAAGLALALVKQPLADASW